MTTFKGEAAQVREPTIADVITGLEYDGWPLKPMTQENLYAQGVDGGIVNYYWPHEVRSVTDSKVTFFKAGTKVMDGDTEIDAPGKPLLVDAPSARGFRLVWDAINEKNRGKTTGFLESRGMTVWMFDKLIWPNIGFGGRS